MNTASVCAGATAHASVPVVCAAAARALRRVLLLTAVAVGGCASLPTDVPRTQSHGLPGLASTPLGRIAAASLAPRTGHPPTGPAEAAPESAFRLLADGREAFDARVALVRRAEHSIDVQTYLVADDASGRSFLAELARAAARGVRVRLLVDDLHAAPVAAPLAALDRDAGAEVRLFNPLPQRQGGVVRRVLLSMHAYPGLNHRMHNKLFIADGAFAIVGGRNVGDVYFGRAATEGFVDLDLLVAGGAIEALNAAFDLYWNDALSVPARSVASAAAGSVRPAPPNPASERSDFGDALDSMTLGLVPGDARVVVDGPDKARGDGRAAHVAAAHLALLASATQRVRVATPYLLPRRRTLGALEVLRGRGIPVSFLTNSLATTDEPLVHLAYARRRPELLGTGAHLQELHGGSTRQRLHAKVAVVDGRRAFVGSLNLDPRSAEINTEVGLMLSGEAITAQLERQLGLWRGQARDAGSAAPESGGAHPPLVLRWLTQLFGQSFL